MPSLPPWLFRVRGHLPLPTKGMKEGLSDSGVSKCSEPVCTPFLQGGDLSRARQRQKGLIEMPLILPVSKKSRAVASGTLSFAWPSPTLPSCPSPLTTGVPKESAGERAWEAGVSKAALASSRAWLGQVSAPQHTSEAPS